MPRSARGWRKSGIAATSARVYGCRGRWITSAAGRVLDDAAGVHDDDPVGHLRDDGEVVGDVDHRHALLVAQPQELGQDPVLREHVEPGRRLVEHRDRRLARRTPSRSRRAAAGRPRAGGGSGGRTRDPRRARRAASAARTDSCGRLARAVGAQHVHDRVADAQRRVERAARDPAARTTRPVPRRLRSARSSRPRIASPPTSTLPPRMTMPRARVAEQRERGRRLAAARLADEAEDLAGADVEADVLDDRARRCAGPSERPLDADDRLRRRALIRRRPLRVVRGTYERPRLRAIASPIRLTPIVSSAIIAAGASTAHAFSEMYWRFSLIMSAQSELGGCSPRPRKLTEAMIRIEYVKRRPKSTSTGARMFGTTSRPDHREGALAARDRRLDVAAHGHDLASRCARPG